MYYDQDGLVTREEWEVFKKQIDKFYQSEGIDNYIAKHNSLEEREARELDYEESQNKSRAEHSQREKKENVGWFYVLKINEVVPAPLTKIGITKNLVSRLKAYEKTYPNYRVVISKKIRNPEGFEKEMRERFKHKSCTVGRDWLVLDDNETLELIALVEQEDEAA
jgi:hypothetical protein